MNVYDASAVIAYLNGEPGGDRVEDLLGQAPALISAANYAEVMSRVYERGTTEADATVLWRDLKIAVEPLTEVVAVAAARMRPETRSLGLSLADRCCLALARSLDNATVVTADRAWKSLKGFRFTFIR
jgi:ribonuclease VapC